MQSEAEICRDFRKGVCFRVNCRYAHINADGTPGTPNDQPVCRDFENGRCFRSNCRFFHRAAPELLAANLANSKRQGEPSPQDLLDRFGPLSLPTHPDYASYGFGSDISPSADFSRDTRALLARELAKRELAISNRMLELSLAERALLELSIRERRQALGRLEPSPYQGLGRPGFGDLNPLGVHPNQTLTQSLSRTRSVPVQSFQDLRGVAPQRHAEVIAPPRLDRRSSVPAHVLDVEAEREAGGFGWQPQGGGDLGEYPNPQSLNRSSSETVQHLQEMRRAADSLLLDMERSRRKESVSMPGSPELMPGDRAPRLELDPRVMNRVVGHGRLPTPDGISEQGQPDGGFQGLERYPSLRSGLTSPELMGGQGLGMQGRQSLSRAGSGIPTPDGRDGLDGRKSPQSFEQVFEQVASQKSPEPAADEKFSSALSGVQEEKSEQSMNGIERDVTQRRGDL